MEPLSPDEEHAFILYLKTLSAGLANVVNLLQKRRAGKQSSLDHALSAQLNVEVMLRELASGRVDGQTTAIARAASKSKLTSAVLPQRAN